MLKRKPKQQPRSLRTLKVRSWCLNGVMACLVSCYYGLLFVGPHFAVMSRGSRITRDPSLVAEILSQLSGYKHFFFNFKKVFCFQSLAIFTNFYRPCNVNGCHYTMAQTITPFTVKVNGDLHIPCPRHLLRLERTADWSSSRPVTLQAR